MSPAPAHHPVLVLGHVALEGRFVRLEPLVASHQADLRAALDSDDEAWAVSVTAGHGAHFEGWWADALAAGAYAVRRLSDGAVVGTSRFYNLRAAYRVVEIGSTFLRPDARRGPVNPEMKRLMLGHAFEAGAVRVEIITDARNARSRAAIARLGAVQEGVLRRHKITWTGHVRDTVMFAVTDLDWPRVRAGLDERLAGWG